MRMNPIRKFLTGTLLAGSLAFGGAAAVTAQTTGATPGAGTATATQGYMGGIYAGTCDELGTTPAVELHELLPIGYDPEAAAEGEATPTTGGVTNVPVISYSNSDDIEFEWQTMIDQPHALAITSDGQTVVACGDIGGTIWDDDGAHLELGLQSVDDSGYIGFAKLAEDNDGQVDVETWVVEPATTDGAATPVASPTEPMATPAG